MPNKQVPASILNKLLGLVLCGALAVGTTGCSICCPGYMDDYATIGGKWARSNPTDGRVGSPFSDPGVASLANYSEDAEATYYDGGIEVVEPYSMQNSEYEADVPGETTQDGVIILGEDW